MIDKIKEAVELLDKYTPDWYTKVNLDDFDISNADKCVCKQVYGDWNKGRQILGVIKNDELSNQLADYNDEWIELISKRQTMSKTMNFVEASQAMKDGKKVRRKSWKYECWHFESNFIRDNNNHVVSLTDNSLENILAADWEIYNDIITFGQVKIGQKFSFINNKVIYKKIIIDEGNEKYTAFKNCGFINRCNDNEKVILQRENV